MSKRESYYAALIRIQRRLNEYFSLHSPDSEESFQSMLDKLLQTAISELRAGGHCQVRKALLLFGTGEGGEKDVIASARMEEADITFSKTLVRQAIQEGRPVFSADAGEDFDDVKSVIDLDIKSIICVPLLARGETIGALYIDSGTAEIFRAEDVDFIALVGWVLGPMIDAVHLKLELRLNRMFMVGMIAAMNIHDSRNVIHQLNLAAQVAQMTHDPIDYEKLIEVVLQSAQSLEGMNRNLLAFIKGEHIQEIELNASRVMQEVVDLVGAQFERKKIHIEADLPEEIPPIRANPVLLKQVFLNLVLNAREAIEGAGNVTIRIAEAPHRRLAISVRDSGKGMSEEERMNLFKPFRSSKDFAGGKDSGGMGIGLWSCRRIVEHFLGGEIEVKSAPGAGTEFVVSVPLTR